VSQVVALGDQLFARLRDVLAVARTEPGGRQVLVYLRGGPPAGIALNFDTGPVAREFMQVVKAEMEAEAGADRDRA
jgi:hypothetical protein